MPRAKTRASVPDDFNPGRVANFEDVPYGIAKLSNDACDSEDQVEARARSNPDTCRHK